MLEVEYQVVRCGLVSRFLSSFRGMTIRVNCPLITTDQSLIKFRSDTIWFMYSEYSLPVSARYRLISSQNSTVSSRFYALQYYS